MYFYGLALTLTEGVCRTKQIQILLPNHHSHKFQMPLNWLHNIHKEEISYFQDEAMPYQNYLGIRAGIPPCQNLGQTLHKINLHLHEASSITNYILQENANVHPMSTVPSNSVMVSAIHKRNSPVYQYNTGTTTTKYEKASPRRAQK